MGGVVGAVLGGVCDGVVVGVGDVTVGAVYGLPNRLNGFNSVGAAKMLKGFRLAGPSRPKMPAADELPTDPPTPDWLPIVEPGEEKTRKLFGLRPVVDPPTPPTT